MHGSVHGWVCMYTTWIGQVGRDHWERSGLGCDVGGEEVIGGVFDVGYSQILTTPNLSFSEFKKVKDV